MDQAPLSVRCQKRQKRGGSGSEYLVKWAKWPVVLRSICACIYMFCAIPVSVSLFVSMFWSTAGICEYMGAAREPEGLRCTEAFRIQRGGAKAHFARLAFMQHGACGMLFLVTQ